MSCAEALARGMLGDQGLELADELRVFSEHELGFDPRLERHQPQLLEPRDLGLRERLVGDVVERRTAPERQGVAGRAQRLLRVAGLEQALGLRQPVLEALDVDVAVVDGEDVAAPTRYQQVAVRRQRLAQLRDIDLDALGGGRRRVLAPELIDQPFRRYDLVAVDQQVDEERRALAGADVSNAVIGEHFEWAKQAEVHFRLRRP
jgi:hypothetical protein